MWFITSILYVIFHNNYRYGFQISGTLLAFAILFVLLNKLPKASIPEGYGNSSVTSCDAGDSPLNYGDRTAFWVSNYLRATIICSTNFSEFRK